MGYKRQVWVKSARELKFKRLTGNGNHQGFQILGTAKASLRLDIASPSLLDFLFLVDFLGPVVSWKLKYLQKNYLTLVHRDAWIENFQGLGAP